MPPFDPFYDWLFCVNNALQDFRINLQKLSMKNLSVSTVFVRGVGRKFGGVWGFSRLLIDFGCIFYAFQAFITGTDSFGGFKPRKPHKYAHGICLLPTPPLCHSFSSTVHST